MSDPKYHSIQHELDAIRAAGRWRATRSAAGRFSSNDYLGLARHPRVLAAACAAVGESGVGAGASRLMAGHHPVHAALEAVLADFLSYPEALLFPSGYQANLGVLTTLATRDAVIYSDALNHASLIDGARLSRATVRVYPHGDTTALAAMLAEDHAAARRLIVTESVFSMDGDLAPLPALADLAQAHAAWLIVDEAHAIGVYGQGRGACAAEGFQPDVLLGTLSKALGSQGGFVACAAPVRDLLVNRARTFIFTTGLAPLCAAAGLAALDIVREPPDLGAALLARAAHLRAALHAHHIDAPGTAHIVPVLLGEEAHALRVAQACANRGTPVHAIRPPTVPPGTCRLRLSLNTAHTDHEIDALAKVIVDAIAECRP